MEKWLSISQLSEFTKIPETTVRRYVNKFDRYFRYEKRSRGRKYHPDSIEVLNRIGLLYSEDYEVTEIDNILSQEFAFTVETEKTTTQPSTEIVVHQSFEEELKNINKRLDQQENDNRKILEQLEEQKQRQEKQEKHQRERDKNLMIALNKSLETQKQIAAAKEKKWWQFWK